MQNVARRVGISGLATLILAGTMAAPASAQKITKVLDSSSGNLTRRASAGTQKLFTRDPRTQMPRLPDRFPRTMFPRRPHFKDLQMVSIADLFARVDIDEHGLRSLASLRRPRRTPAFVAWVLAQLYARGERRF